MLRILGAAFFLSWAVTTASGGLRPYGAQYGDIKAIGGDDECNLQFTYSSLPVFGRMESKIYVCTNGLISLGRPIVGQPIYNSFPLPNSSLSNTTLAAFWSDINTMTSGSIWARNATSGAEIVTVSKQVSAAIGLCSFSASWMLVATWDRVHEHGSNTAASVTFQIVLITDDVSTYVMYNYGALEWPAQGSGRRVLIGFDAQNGNHFQVPLSGPTQIRSMGTGNFSSNVDIPGTWIFHLYGMHEKMEYTTFPRIQCHGQSCGSQSEMDAEENSSDTQSFDNRTACFCPGGAYTLLKIGDALVCSNEQPCAKEITALVKKGEQSTAVTIVGDDYQSLLLAPGTYAVRQLVDRKSCPLVIKVLTIDELPRRLEFRAEYQNIKCEILNSFSRAIIISTAEQRFTQFKSACPQECSLAKRPSIVCSNGTMTLTWSSDVTLSTDDLVHSSKMLSDISDGMLLSQSSHGAHFAEITIIVMNPPQVAPNRLANQFGPGLAVTPVLTTICPEDPMQRNAVGPCV